MTRDGKPVTIGGPKLRVLLAALLVRANTTVSLDRLADHLWGEDQPSTARKSTQVYALRLRRTLGDGLIETRPDGYLIRVRPDQLDLLRFRQLAEAGREAGKAGDSAAELASLAEALECWRGRPLCDVPSESLQRDEAARLGEDRLRTLERWIEAGLEAGRHGELVAELITLTKEHPWQETFWAQLIVALDRSGRRADALDTYRSMRRMFADELGIEPGPRLRRAHDAILHEGPSTEPPRETICQLPPDVHRFVGRAGTIAELAALSLTETGRNVVISGPPGVGKTAFAVHVAHRFRPHYPDGQLYVNLQGYAAGPPLDPSAALTRFLGALGVHRDRVPAEPAEQAALFRSVLADKKMVLLLDNAVHVDQVRPLLPGRPGCTVLITSRNDLRGLAVDPGAVHLPLGVLTEPESRAVLAELLGPERTTAEPDAVGELAAACAHLPLALRIAGANLAADTGRGIAEYTAELTRSGRLEELAIDGDASSAVRGAFDRSYVRLSEEDRALFRMLGRVPGPDFGVPAAAAVAGLPRAETGRALDRLAAANLLQRHAPGRYQFHDLIREYAAERGHAEDPPEHAAAALSRMIDSYVETAAMATRVLYAGAASPVFDEHTALRWLDTERYNLVDTIAHATTDPAYQPAAWRLIDVLRGYLQASGYAREAVAACTTALRSATEAGDLRARLSLLDVLGQMSHNLSDYGLAVEHFQQALEAARELKDLDAEADALRNLGRASSQQGKARQALHFHGQALSVSRAAGNTGAETLALNYIGVIHTFSGRPRTAVGWHERSLALARETGQREAAFHALNGRGIALWALGRLEESLSDHEQVLAYTRESGHGFGETATLVCLAETNCDAGRLDLAMAQAQECHARSVQIGDRRGEATAAEVIATVRNRRGEHVEALVGLHEALHVFTEIGFGYGEGSARLGLAIAYRSLGEAAKALEYSEKALTTLRENGQLLLEADVLTEIARDRLDLGEPEEARRVAGEAVRLAAKRGRRLPEERAREVLELIRGNHSAKR
ncbi:AfsR/SARP family transcriptional regulator [Amycolatopsis pittospori]|uniref:AfsR/SARP family transcriptional regulator n=1 Tax=Amycolatopsis pittospori TaxID=2749434 RepID=UPI002E29818F|nr:BTAD domain-containing putative transcriptional regulator [Amycolatopsis pittospori]